MFKCLLYFDHLGGVPSVEKTTTGRFTKNFDGCISEIYVMHYGPIRIPEDTIAESNVDSC